MKKENGTISELPSNCCYSMLNAAFGDSLSVTRDLTCIGEGVFSYTVTVPDEAKASVIGSLMCSAYSKGMIVMKSFVCDESGGENGFSVCVEEKIF